MKIIILLLLLLSSVTFAYDALETSCRKSCCNSYVGTWQDAEEYCEPATDDYETYLTYQECVTDCLEGGSSVGCCGSAFVLLTISGFVMMKK